MWEIEREDIEWLGTRAYQLDKAPVGIERLWFAIQSSHDWVRHIAHHLCWDYSIDSIHERHQSTYSPICQGPESVETRQWPAKHTRIFYWCRFPCVSVYPQRAWGRGIASVTVEPSNLRWNWAFNTHLNWPGRGKENIIQIFSPMTTYYI